MITRNLPVIVSIFLLFISCEKRKVDENISSIEGTDSRLELIGQYKLQIPEPSGLTITSDGNSLWTVSDENNTIYKITRKGDIIDSITVDASDLEGVTSGHGNSLIVIAERDRAVLVLDSSYQLAKRLQLNLYGDLNSGIEGVTYDSNSNVYFIVNEKNPGKLYQLDFAFNITNEYELKFASDYSGLFYDPDKDVLWIQSDESRLIAKCKTDGSLIDKFFVNIQQMEGLAIDFEKSLIYIVSDITETLYVFRLNEN